jgi:hypothetical protein
MSKEPTDAELIKKLELPENIRTFGMILRRREEYEAPFYSGSNGRFTINLGMQGPHKWLAVALFSSCNVNPGLTSSSFKAALRNLRGHLRNLAIDLDRSGIKPR